MDDRFFSMGPSSAIEIDNIPAFIIPTSAHQTKDRVHTAIESTATYDAGMATHSTELPKCDKFVLKEEAKDDTISLDTSEEDAKQQSDIKMAKLKDDAYELAFKFEESVQLSPISHNCSTYSENSMHFMMYDQMDENPSKKIKTEHPTPLTTIVGCNINNNNNIDSPTKITESSDYKLKDLIAFKKPLQSMAATIFNHMYGSDKLLITTDGIEIHRQTASNVTESIDSIDIGLMRKFCRLFRSALTNLHVIMNEENSALNNKSGVDLKYLCNATFPALRAFSLKVCLGRNKCTRSYRSEIERMLKENPQIEWLKLDMDLDMRFMPVISSSCPQLQHLSFTCDVGKLYTYEGSVIASFANVKVFELDFSDRYDYEYEPKMLTDLPFTFQALDEFRLDLTNGGFGNDFTDMITRNANLTKLHLMNLLFDFDERAPLVRYAQDLKQLKEFVVDAHSLTARDIMECMGQSKSLAAVDLLDMSEEQNQLVSNNCIDGWSIVEATALRGIYDGSHMKCGDLKLRRIKNE